MLWRTNYGVQPVFGSSTILLAVIDKYSGLSKRVGKPEDVASALNVPVPELAGDFARRAAP